MEKNKVKYIKALDFFYIICYNNDVLKNKASWSSG